MAKFKCLNCGGCCKDVLFHNLERKLVLKFAEDNSINKRIICRFRHSLEYTTILWERDYYFLKDQCPFRVDNKCLVYKARPTNCRRFMCGRMSSKEKLTWDERRCLNLEVHYNADEEFKKQVNQNVQDVANWALKKGISK